MVARITPTSGKELTVLEQILGNVGKFSGPRQAAGNPGAPTGGGWLGSEAAKEKAPVLATGAFPLALCRRLSARARRAAAGPRCW